MTRNSQENPQPACNLLLSQRQHFLENLLAQIPITPNQQGTFEMRQEFFSGTGAQDMYNSGYELLDLKDVKFVWESPRAELDAIFISGIDTSFSQTAFNDLEMEERGSSQNLFLLDEEEDKENSPPTTPVSERP